jgi:hypothetical protein
MQQDKRPEAIGVRSPAGCAGARVDSGVGARPRLRIAGLEAVGRRTRQVIEAPPRIASRHRPCSRGTRPAIRVVRGVSEMSKAVDQAAFRCPHGPANRLSSAIGSRHNLCPGKNRCPEPKQNAAKRNRIRLGSTRSRIGKHQRRKGNRRHQSRIRAASDAIAVVGHARRPPPSRPVHHALISAFRLQEGRKAGVPPELRTPPIDRPGPGLPMSQFDSA